jgi:hypothetical protein
MRNQATRSFGALYYPWLLQGDDIFPPSGAVAGTFAHSELSRRPFGVGWPPANIPIQGVTHTEVDLPWEEAGELAEAAINPLVVQPGRGVVAFGARTLIIEGPFQYVNSRRILNMVMEQLRRDSEWAVFETNNPHLWDVLERDVAFRLDEFAGGGVAWDDGWFAGFGGCDGVVADVEAEIAFAVIGVGAVAVEAVVGEDGADVAVVAERGCGGVERQQQQSREGEPEHLMNLGGGSGRARLGDGPLVRWNERRGDCVWGGDEAS